MINTIGMVCDGRIENKRKLISEPNFIRVVILCKTKEHKHLQKIQNAMNYQYLESGTLVLNASL